MRWVYQQARQEVGKAGGLEGRECLAGLFHEFSDVRKSSVVEGMDFASGVKVSFINKQGVVTFTKNVKMPSEK